MLACLSLYSPSVQSRQIVPSHSEYPAAKLEKERGGVWLANLTRAMPGGKSTTLASRGQYNESMRGKRSRSLAESLRIFDTQSC